MSERFELLERIGRGGMGVVWKARDSTTGDVVALKLLHDMFTDDPDYVIRFEREVDVARRINHRNVVRSLGYGRRDGVPYVVMEYVDGPSLDLVLRQRGALPWPEVRPLAAQLAAGLRAAHAAGVLHRDIKPSNVLLTRDGTAKLADFGIARAADMSRLTGSSTMLGTPQYMAPEGQLDERSDLYSLGVVLYEALAGRRPFDGGSPQQLLLQHMRDAPDLAQLPAEARPIVGWLLQKRPTDRPRTAIALSAAINGDTPPPRTATRVRPLTAGRSRTPVVVGAGIGVLSIAAAAGIVLGVVASSGGGDGAADPPAATATSSPTPPSTTVAPTVAPATPTVTNTPGQTPSRTPGPDQLRVGSRVRVINSPDQSCLWVRKGPGRLQGQTNIACDGDTGTIQQGPVMADGLRWWYIAWDHYRKGVDGPGWSADADGATNFLVPAQ